MKKLTRLYWKIFGAFLLVIIMLGSIYIYIAYKTAISYYEETSQQLNIGVAHQIATDIRPLLKAPLKKSEVEKHFRNVMTLNPAAEIYLLDENGLILACSAPDSAVKRNTIALDPVEKLIATQGNAFIDGDNPRRESGRKPFSAARIENNGVPDGYIYIILGGDKYEHVTSFLMDSYKLRIAIASIIFSLFAAFIIGRIAFIFITRDLNKLITHVKGFQEGNRQERIHLNSGSELQLLAETFNSMTDTIAANIENIQTIEQSRRELIANVSHDLRTPLATIQGYAETLVLKKNMLSEDEKEHYSQIVVKSATKLKNLVDELFELSKLEANAVVPHVEQFSISELLLDNVLKYRILAEEKDITIHTNIPNDIPLVHADIGLIDRVLQNLMDNALKFTPAKGTVIAGLKQIDNSVEVSISDNGEGILPERLPYIFERYSHFDDKKADKDGIGLGLAIVRKILELHTTNIQVKSGVVEGSIFSFTLPRGKTTQS